jgi:glycopeptide antibiotics resistance protein
MKSGKLKTLFTIAFMLAIFLSSLIALDGTARGFEFFENISPAVKSLLHIPLFFVFTLVLLRVFNHYESQRAVQIASALILANYVGLLNEWLQSTIPYRHFSWLDVLYNLAGSLIAVYVHSVFANRSFKPFHKSENNSPFQHRGSNLKPPTY